MLKSFTSVMDGCSSKPSKISHPERLSFELVQGQPFFYLKSHRTLQVLGQIKKILDETFLIVGTSSFKVSSNLRRIIFCDENGFHIPFYIELPFKRSLSVFCPRPASRNVAELVFGLNRE